jgi:hypothetical protein
MASVTLHADGRVEFSEPPTPEEIAEAEQGLRRVAAALMGMAIEQLEREDRERAAAACAVDQGGAAPRDD